LPAVNAIAAELRGRGLEVLLVDFREDPALVRRTARERGYTARILLDQSGDVTGRVYGVWGPPTVYLIDRAGQLVGRATGPRGWDQPPARRLLEALLAEGGGR
jgi:hypothetical protein